MYCYVKNNEVVQVVPIIPYADDNYEGLNELNDMELGSRGYYRLERVDNSKGSQHITSSYDINHAEYKVTETLYERELSEDEKDKAYKEACKHCRISAFNLSIILSQHIYENHAMANEHKATIRALKRQLNYLDNNLQIMTTKSINELHSKLQDTANKMFMFITELPDEIEELTELIEAAYDTDSTE